MKFKKDNILPILNIPLVCLSTFILVSCYEILKSILLAEAASWQSHMITIMIFTGVSGFIAFALKKKLGNLQNRTESLEMQNQVFQRQISDFETRRQERKKWEKTFDAIEDWICIISLDSTILRSNKTVEKYFDLKVQKSIGIKCCQLVHGTDVPIEICPLPRMIQTQKREAAEVKNKGGRWMKITVDPIFDSDGNLSGAVHITRDITQRVMQNHEREKLLADLQKAVSHIKTLKGLIPICSKCKKIRDDKGFWNQIEFYIEENSEAEFSHGMCPECTDKLYGDQEWYIHMKREKGRS